MGDRQNDNPQGQQVATLHMRSGESVPRLDSARARLWPQQLRLTSLPSLQVLICDDARPRPGFTLLDASAKAVLLKMATEEWEPKNKGKPRPAWLPAPEGSSDSAGQAKSEAKKDANPPFVQVQLQFLPPGTSPSATLHLDMAHRGKPSLEASWDSQAAGFVGQVVVQFHKENESGWELTLGTQANVNLGTHPGVTGLQGNAQAAYVKQLNDVLQIQGIIQAQIQSDLSSPSVASVAAGGQLNVKVTEQVSLTGTVMAGPSRVMGSGGAEGGNRMDVTATFGVTVSIF
jgi:hypothetical protein